MKRMLFGIGMMLTASVAIGQTMPAMPPGHPSMEQMMSAAATQPSGGATPGTLPPGHPPMGQAKGGAMPGGMPAGAMPPGHPSLEQIMAGGATTQAAPLKITGKFTVQLVPGTAGGKLDPNDVVTVELFHRQSVVKKYADLKADAGGKVVLADVPVMPPVEAMVSVTHAGLVQQATAPEMNPSAPETGIEMKVYETTEVAPAWSVGMAHAIVDFSEDGTAAQITEMIACDTAGDRAWLGAKAGELRSTITLPLPEGVTDVNLMSGFDVNATRFEDGKVISGGPLYPGRSIYRFSYTVAAKNGALQLPITTPAAVGNLMVSVPAEGGDVTATGLAGGEVVQMGEGPGVRMYSAQNLAAGATVTLSVTGLGKAAAEVPESKFTAKNVAMGGGFLLALVAVGMLLMKKPRKEMTKGE